MVAMFRYSRVATYTVSVPTEKMEFNSPINKSGLLQEIETVYTKGLLVFEKVDSFLKKVEHKVSGQNLLLNGSLKGVADIFDMLKVERSEFEASMKSSIFNNENSQNSIHELLGLNWDILLEACVWERRLQSLRSLLGTLPLSAKTKDMAHGQLNSQDSGIAREEAGAPQTASQEVWPRQTVTQDSTSVEGKGRQKRTDEEVKVELQKDHGEGTVPTATDGVNRQTPLNEHTAKEIPRVQETANSSRANAACEVHIQEVEGGVLHVKECSNGERILHFSSDQGSISLPIAVENLKTPTSGELSHESDPKLCFDSHPNDRISQKDISQKDATLLHNSIPEERSISINRDEVEKACAADEEVSKRVSSPPLSNTYSRGWIWDQFSQIREECMKELRRGYLPKFGHIPKFEVLHSQGLESDVSKVIAEEGSRVHIPLRDGDYIVSDFDGETSSSVACALALIKDLTPAASDNDENGTLKRADSAPAPDYTRNSSHDRDMIHSATSFSFSVSRFPTFDGLNNLDTLVSYGQIHPEVTLGLEKYSTKGKYSVVIIHASEFRAFREQCCPSELDYIASLSGCRNWDAKGGKSKSLFAKTFDDRLIIKEIKKAELDSFMKFAGEYFRHMKDAVESGNQTCLAKILGIYQVSIRNPKSGKETKHDLMVMENLSFGRNVTRQYDLKGTLHARFTVTSDGTGDVLLDQNFVNV